MGWVQSQEGQAPHTPTALPQHHVVHLMTASLQLTHMSASLNRTLLAQRQAGVGMVWVQSQHLDLAPHVLHLLLVVG